MNYFLFAMLKIKPLIPALFLLSYEIVIAQSTSSEQARIIKLEEAIQFGFQNNRQLKMVKTDVAIANENVSQAKNSL